MLYEIVDELSFYHTDQIHYIILRYIIIIFSAFLVVYEYYDICTEIYLLSKFKIILKKKRTCFFGWFKFSFLLKGLLAILSHVTICLIIVTSHLGQEKGIGLILNFAAGVIIIEIDNIIVKGFVND